MFLSDLQLPIIDRSFAIVLTLKVLSVKYRENSVKNDKIV